MLVLRDRLREAIEELLHGLGIHVWQDEREGVVGAGLDGCEDVGKREALVAQAKWALPALPPNVASPPLLADARLILEE
jgi:hypothetical protein